MIDVTPIITPEARRLMNMSSEVVYAKDIAPIVHMSPSVIISHVKNGLWDEKSSGKVQISGDRVKFFRIDFLVKHGFLQPKPQEKTTEQLLKDVLFHLDLLAKAVISLQDARQREMFLRLIEEHKKTASAATPADSGKEN